MTGRVGAIADRRSLAAATAGRHMKMMASRFRFGPIDKVGSLLTNLVTPSDSESAEYSYMSFIHVPIHTSSRVYHRRIIAPRMRYDMHTMCRVRSQPTRRDATADTSTHDTRALSPDPLVTLTTPYT